MEVEKQFSFIETLGFKRTQSNPTYVEYESEKLRINIYHGRKSFEIGLELSEITQRHEVYSFSEILRSAGIAHASEYRNFMASDISGVVEGISRIKNLFEIVLRTGFFENVSFAELEAQKINWAIECSVQTRLDDARRKSLIAWKKKDYDGVIKALSPFRSVLDLTEKRRLKFSEKRRLDK